MGHDLFRLHVLEPGLLQVGLDLLRGRPVRARDQGCFEARVHFPARVGPRDRDARVDRIGPGVDAEHAAGGDDAREFFDAGGAVVCQVDVCAGETVGDAVGGDVLGVLKFMLGLGFCLNGGESECGGNGCRVWSFIFRLWSVV